MLADIALSDEDDDLIKIPLIPEDQITFTVYYAYLKSATLSSEVETLFHLIKSYEYKKEHPERCSLEVS